MCIRDSDPGSARSPRPIRSSDLRQVPTRSSARTDPAPPAPRTAPSPDKSRQHRTRRRRTNPANQRTSRPRAAPARLHFALANGDARGAKVVLDLAERQGAEVEHAGREDSVGPGLGREGEVVSGARTCLLYTSDAADDLLCVDLGGRRIIKKKKKRRIKK